MNNMFNKKPQQNESDFHDFEMYTFLSKYIKNYEETVLVQSYSETFLKFFEEVEFNISGTIKATCTPAGESKDNQAFRLTGAKYTAFDIKDKTKYISRDIVDYLDENPQHYSNKYFYNFSDDMEREEIESRIYDMALFVNEDFCSKPMNDKKETLFDIYNSSCLKYCEKTKNPIIAYQFQRKDNDSIDIKFDNFCPIGFDKEQINKDSMFTNEDIKLAFDEEKTEIESDRLSFRKYWLSNFWASMLANNQFEKFNDIKLFLFLFLERIETIKFE